MQLIKRLKKISSLYQSYRFNVEETNWCTRLYISGNFQKPLAFLKTKCIAFLWAKLQSSFSRHILRCLEIRGNCEWFSCFFVLFLPISFKLEARSWQPVGQLSLWTCFVWTTGCFLKIWTSCQHLKKQDILPKKKKNPDFLLFLKNWEIQGYWGWVYKWQ